MKIELIEWVDSHLYKDGWFDPEDFNFELEPITSIGYVMKEEDHYVVVAPHFSAYTVDSDSVVYGLLIIPKGSILKRVQLYEPSALTESVSI